jgi:F-type H+-transporting ATPase subunit beta
MEQLSLEDRNAVARARRLERFLTQPFFTTEQFSGMKGKLVSLKDSLDGCERILHDEFKDYPESALYMIGAIGEAKKPETKQSEAKQSDAKKPESRQPEAKQSDVKMPATDQPEANKPETTKPNEGKAEIAKTDPQPEAATASTHEP